ncbi:MAG: YmdB family metallophosphoesterase, partial [Mycoplasmataceae bacterium]|nr:YmdB family metallophosphoesterase [Mycoplasmataceae bacterium]
QTNPFLTLKNVIENDSSDIHIIDFHCETTSEKNALLLSFAGSVGAILGTHTHIQTNDNKIYNGTAYITDVGMTGGSEGIIGAEAAPILEVFHQRTEHFKMSPSNTKYQLNAVVLTFDDITNRATNIEKITILQK